MVLGSHDNHGSIRAPLWQVENIRAQLSASLTGGQFPANDTDLSKSVSISQTIPGLGLVATGGPSSSGGNGIGDDDIFGDADEDKSRLSRADLERAVLERKRTRPAGIERQVGWGFLGSAPLQAPISVYNAAYSTI